MSVQNGERLATKQDLADMYQGILPYLGGMPEVLANKFSKGDLYSTDEKMIGQWVDGKPLYQKVVLIDFTKSSTTREYVNILDMSSYNVDTIVNGFGSFINDVSSDVKTKIFTLADQNARATIVYDRSTKYLQLLCYEMNGWKIKGCVTIQYTKTTDSAISIGSDTDYSTEEKIVGTWIDGKPIYQKTFVADTYWQVSGTTEIAEMNDSSLNIEHIVNFVALTQSISGATWQDGTVMMQVSKINNVYKVIPKENGRFNIFTIQYTKTTD